MTEILRYKPDWEETKERLQAWWKGERTDRTVALVRAPRDGAELPRVNTKLPDYYTDFETIAGNQEMVLEYWFYGGESFPAQWIYHGPVPMTAYFGGEPHFRPDTVWYDQQFPDWESASSWEFDPNNRWWQMALDVTRRSVERARGRYLVSGCGMGGLADVIANLWGSESLMAELVEDPAVIASLLRRMVAAYRVMYDELYDIAAQPGEGYFDWLGIWAPGRVASLQNDMSCMISPAMFRDVFLEEIRREAEHVDYSFYHLDGPGAIKQLDALLSIERLNGIQWMPGAGASYDPMDWLDLIKRVGDKGKKVLVCCTPERIKPLLNAVDRRSLLLGLDCKDEATARACLAELERIGT